MGLRIASNHPPGLIGIASNTMGRYREFNQSLDNVEIPKMSKVRWEVGGDIAFNFNNLCRFFLEHEELQWLWILGDDHTFRRNTLMKLLGRDVDIVVPLCLKCTPDFGPVAYKVKDGKHYQLTLNYFEGKTGLLRVDACGNAGMLIRRHVIEDIGDDWHRVGWIDPDRGSSDLYFCKKAREADFDIHVDLDNHIGHLMHMAVWPTRDINNTYSVGIGQGYEYPSELHCPHVPDVFSKKENK